MTLEKSDLIIQFLDYSRHHELSMTTDLDEDSSKAPMLIKVYGITPSGESITVNVHGFQPFFYIKIPEEWQKKDYNVFVKELKKLVYYKSRDGLVKCNVIYRKPFDEFTGDDYFKFMKLTFINKECYDSFRYKLRYPIKIVGLNKNKKHKYQLYESDIEPILKFIHMTDIKSTGWITIPKGEYKVTEKHTRFMRSTHTKYEISTKWTAIKPYDKQGNGQFNVAAYDIESDSSHGDFPIAKKTYQKLAQELVTLFNRQKVSKKNIEICMKLAFEDRYHNLGIHHIKTLQNKIPHPSTIELVASYIKRIYKDIDILELHKILEYNFPEIDVDSICNSNYRLLSEEICSGLQHMDKRNQKWDVDDLKYMISLAFNPYFDGYNVSHVYTKQNRKPDIRVIECVVPDVYKVLEDCYEYMKKEKKQNQDDIVDGKVKTQDFFVKKIDKVMSKYFPPVEGDKLIQVGTTFQRLGESHCYLKHIITLDTCDTFTNEDLIEDEFVNKSGKIDNMDDYKFAKDHDKAEVIIESYQTEKEVLMAWKDLVLRTDPDMIIGYNVFGFDYKFLYERAEELNCEEEFCQLGRVKDQTELLVEKQLKGHNTVYYIPMEGRVHIDLYKYIQKTYPLSSYKLDNVAKIYLGKQKNDMPPSEIFIRQKGTSSDRALLARYCVIDCILCNRLLTTLRILGSNIAMANICKVPLSYIFMRGQGIKGYSLIADVCAREGYVIPVLPILESDDSFEGAIVLDPESDIYFEPISVADFNSLYPSSIISENLSHDTVVEIAGKYDNLPDYEYNNITYDVYRTYIKGKYRGTNRCLACVSPYDSSQCPIKLTKRITTHDLKNPSKEKVFCFKHRKQRRVETVRKALYKEKVGEKTSRYAVAQKDPETNEMEKFHGIIPKILQKLLATRKGTKKKMKAAAADGNKLLASLYDDEQLAQKITANSLYGLTGAKTSKVRNMDIAASTTAIGRSMINFSKEYVEREYKDKIVELHDLDGDAQRIHVKNTTCVYGDSVTGDTPLLIKKPDGTIDIVSIDSLCNMWFEYKNFKVSAIKDYGLRYCKEQGITDVKVWSRGKWTNIRRVIRHKTNKKIYRVYTYKGCVDITEDHSLLTNEGVPIKPGECKLGQKLLHSFPSFEKNNEDKYFRKQFNNKVTAQWVYYMLSKKGYDVRITGRQHGHGYIIYVNQGIFNNMKKYVQMNPYRIRDIFEIGRANDLMYVYDLETDEGVFNAGIGEIVVKNTDSIFIKFNLYRDNSKLTGLEAIFKSMKLCERVSKEISLQLKPPQNLEFEKVIYPFILITKKRYHGHYYTKYLDESYKKKSMGIVLKRRDNAPIVKKIFGGAVDIIMMEHDIKKSIEFVKDSCRKLLNGEYPFEDFVVSKTLRSYYKKPNQIAHNVLAMRQAQRDPGNKFMPNDRVPYVYVETKNKDALQGERIETPDFVRQNNLKIDYKMYLTNQILKPVSQIFELVGVDIEKKLQPIINRSTSNGSMKIASYF